MTFQEYFTEVQKEVTKEIDLPFDCLFSQDWTDKYTPQFIMCYDEGLTPYEAMKEHFLDIDNNAILQKKRKTLMKK